jgi:hypothetical protein
VGKKAQNISTPRHWPSSKWVNRLYDYLPILTLTVSVWKKRIGYIKIFTIKSTPLFHRGKPLLTKHYRGETLDHLWNQV